jgi:phage portal protein BeeE
LGLLDRINASRGLAPTDEQRYSLDTWIQDSLIPSSFQYNGTSYPILGNKGTLAGNRAMEISQTLPSYAHAIRQVPPAFAAQLVRALVLSQARFTFRNLPWVKPQNPKRTKKGSPNGSSSAAPRRLFTSPELALLERPWKNGSTGELISRMEWHAGLAGAAFVARRKSNLQILRPDWTGVVWGSDSQPDNPAHALDRVLIGYFYCNGGFNNEFGYKPEFLLADECIHWAPIPDPLGVSVGESWLAPAIRDLQSDRLASDHKIRYWENGATPNLVVTGIPTVTRTQFDELVDMMEERHAGAANAFRTLYLTAGADAKVIGNNFHEIDFRAVTAAGETRIAMLSRVPAVILQIWDGLQGSSLNAGNFAAARRTFADGWINPTLQELAKSLAPLIKVPGDAELWYDTTDIGLLREDAKDQAEIDSVKAGAIRNLVDGGFDPITAIRTIAPEWLQTLEHTGNVSVQLQPPGAHLQNANEVGQLLQPKNDSG